MPLHNFPSDGWTDLRRGGGGRLPTTIPSKAILYFGFQPQRRRIIGSRLLVGLSVCLSAFRPPPASRQLSAIGRSVGGRFLEILKAARRAHFHPPTPRRKGEGRKRARGVAYVLGKRENLHCAEADFSTESRDRHNEATAKTRHFVALVAGKGGSIRALATTT